MSDNPSALERRCVDAYARASETTDYGTELNTLGIVRAVLAEAGVAELVEACKLFVKYDEGDQISDVTLMLDYATANMAIRAALAKIGASQ